LADDIPGVVREEKKEKTKPYELAKKCVEIIKT
jgi:hypothetical protein